MGIEYYQPITLTRFKLCSCVSYIYGAKFESCLKVIGQGVMALN